MIKEWKFEYIMKHQLYTHHFQPIVHLEDESIRAYESLLRVDKLTTPELLFEKAASLHRLLELDLSSIQKAFQIFSQQTNMTDQRIRLFVNMFPSTVMSPSFYEQFTHMLAENHMAPENIVFELNECEVVIDYEVLKKSIDRLRQLNVRFALDDFGTGYCSLRKIIELEPKYIKLDKYFAHDLAKSEKKQDMVQTMLQYFNAYGMTTILEGLEEEADVHAAKALGISYGQGFYFSKPKPIQNMM